MKGRRESIAPITGCAQVCPGCTSPAQRPDGTIKVDENQPRQARRRRVLADCAAHLGCVSRRRDRGGDCHGRRRAADYPGPRRARAWCPRIIAPQLVAACSESQPSPTLPLMGCETYSQWVSRQKLDQAIRELAALPERI